MNITYLDWVQIGSPHIYIRSKYFRISYISEKSEPESDIKLFQIRCKWVRYGSDS